MSKSIHCVILLMILIVSAGCNTVQGAATGLNKDVQNVSNPDENGWNAIKHADAWIQENMW